MDETGSRAQQKRAKNRRHSDRREKRQGSSRPRPSHGGSDKDRRDYHNPLRRPSHHHSRHHERSNHADAVETTRGDHRRHPQHQLAFEDTNITSQKPETALQNDNRNRISNKQGANNNSTRNLKGHHYYSNAANNCNNHQSTFTSAENALFGFPWKWNPGAGEEGLLRTKKHREEELRKDSTETEESRRGVPSVVFAIHDADNNNDADHETPTPSPISEPKIIKKPRHHHQQQQQQQQQQELRHNQHRHHHHQRRHKQDELPDDLRPIAPTPQVPVMVGNREDPIPCSDSLVGSVSRRYAINGQMGGTPTRKRPPNYRRTPKKESIQDLTALESISTYDLEQRYKVKEVQNILESSKRAFGRDLIALPKLDGKIRDPVGGEHNKDRYTTNRGSHALPFPGRVDGHLVYNLSESSQKRQSKGISNIAAHTTSISQGLEKMRSNLRQKQHQLSHAVFDLKAKQKQQQEATSFVDRMRNTVSQRNPDTAPLLQNQNYISDIFTDIASKITFKSDNQDATTSKSKGPYVPKVSSILNSKKEYDREHGVHESGQRNRRNKGRRPHGAAQAPPGFLGPAPAYPLSDASKYRHPSRSKRYVHDDITTIEVNDPCSITSPITEQFSNLLSPGPFSHSSLYLPNIRSRRSTPVADKTLPFRPSAGKSTPAHDTKFRFASTPFTTERQSGARRSRHSEMQYDNEGAVNASRLPRMEDSRDYQGHGGEVRSRFPFIQEIIDVTSQASSLQFKDVVDLTDLSSADIETTNRKGRDVIDVTSLASSRLSKTTVKNVICVDEDSRGVIRAKRKLAAMPKKRRQRSGRGPPPTKSTGQRRLSDNYDGIPDWNKFRYSRWDNREYSSREAPVKNIEVKVTKKEAEDAERIFGNPYESQQFEPNDDELNGDEEEEHEIVFVPSPSANRGLFDGIWDMDLPKVRSKEESKELSPKQGRTELPHVNVSRKSKSVREQNQDAQIFAGVLPKNKSPMLPSQSSKEALFRPRPPPVSTHEMQGPSFNSTHNQTKIETHRLSSKRSTPNRPQLQPPEVKEGPPKLRTPMEASAHGRASSPLTRASSRIAIESTSKGRASNPPAQYAGGAIEVIRSPSPHAPSASGASGLGTTTTLQARSAVSGAATTPALPTSASGMENTYSTKAKSLSRGLAPPIPQATSGSPPTRRIARGQDPSMFPWTRDRRRSQFPALARRRDAPITVVNQREPEGTVSVAPMISDDDQDETMSDEQEETEETAEENDIPIPAPPQIVRPKPIRRASAFARRGNNCERSMETRSVTFHEGDTLLGPKDETIPNFICTDHQTVETDISWKRNKSVRRTVHPWDKDSQGTGSSREAFHDLSTRDKRESDKKSLDRSRARRHESRRASRNGSIKRSMYDEVLDATEGQQVIIVDDEGSQQYEVVPADSPNRFNRKKKLWDDVSDLNNSFQSHGKNWETLGDPPASNQETGSTPSKARSRRSARREAERSRRDQAMFFDFLCF